MDLEFKARIEEKSNLMPDLILLHPHKIFLDGYEQRIKLIHLPTNNLKVSIFFPQCISQMYFIPRN